MKGKNFQNKMKSEWRKYLEKTVCIGIVLILLIPALWAIVELVKLDLSWNPFILWRPQQKQLASDLGVDPNDYPSPRYFPEGYFETKLGPGTDISVVHGAITGYNKVFHCDEDKREVYYYFSSDEFYSLRFEVWYNDDWTVLRINGEDEDSRTISNGCPEGHIMP